MQLRKVYNILLATFEKRKGGVKGKARDGTMVFDTEDGRQTVCAALVAESGSSGSMVRKDGRGQPGRMAKDHRLLKLRQGLKEHGEENPTGWIKGGVAMVRRRPDTGHPRPQHRSATKVHVARSAGDMRSRIG